MDLTTNQKEFLERALMGENIFLTGKAGTGKSFIVRHMMDELKLAGRSVVAVAPTGIAANNIEGQTIHSLFRLNPFEVLNFELCNFLNPNTKQLLRKVDTIVIDEISMLRPDVLDGIHLTLKKNGLKGLEKKQVIFVGDLKQLPAILDDNTRAVLYETYNGDTFDEAFIYAQLNVKTIELSEVLRQTNEEFINNLNVIREGGKSPYFKRFVSSEARGIILAPHNSTVQMYNEAGLKAQDGEVHTFTAVVEGGAKPEDFRLEREIRVKEGCKIMYLVNSRENPLRNGTLGTFHVKGKQYFIRVGKVDYPLEKTILSKKEYVYNKQKDALELQEKGSITQYPFKLAYALSIHKAQGLTFEEVTIDLSRPCFQKGQMYVGLSRVKTPEGLRIIVS